MTQSAVDARSASACANAQIARWPRVADVAEACVAVDHIVAFAVTARIRLALVYLSFAARPSEARQTRAIVRARCRLIRDALASVEAWIVCRLAQVDGRLTQHTRVAGGTVAGGRAGRHLVADAIVRAVVGGAGRRVLGAVFAAVRIGALANELIGTGHQTEAVVEARTRRHAQVDERVAQRTRVARRARTGEHAGLIDHAQAAVLARIGGAYVQQRAASVVGPAERTRANEAEAVLDAAATVEARIDGAKIDGRRAERVGVGTRADAREARRARRHASAAVLARIGLTRIYVYVAVFARKLSLTRATVVAYAGLRCEAKTAVLARHARAEVDGRLTQRIGPAAAARTLETVDDGLTCATVQAG